MNVPASPEDLSVGAAGTLAAGLLEASWRTAPGDTLRAGVVRELAQSLGNELEAIVGHAGDAAPADALVEAALRAADVANLAASSLADLSGESAAEAVAAAHLAAGAARALVALAEAGASDLDGDRAEYVLKDARSAAWRARFAVRLTDEFMGVSG